jgi:hypothetical protein
MGDGAGWKMDGGHGGDGDEEEVTGVLRQPTAR